jgi:carboxyl-terminal processing protease
MSSISHAPLRLKRFCTLAFFVAVLAGSLMPAAWADPVGPRPEDRQITLGVRTLLLREHVSRHPLDKEIAARWIKTFLKSLDPMKVYFYQSDVDEFMQQKDKLVPMIERNDISFAYFVFQRFLQRVDERVKMVDELLAQPMDFTVDEEMVIDRDQLQYPKDPTEARERWRKRLKYDVLVLKTDKDKKKAAAASKDQIQVPGDKDAPDVKGPDLLRGTDATAPKTETASKEVKEEKNPIERLTQRYHSFDKRMHQTDADELLEIYLNSLTTAFDPHTDYMSPSTQENFDIMMRLKLEGIGASLQSDDGYTVVKHLVPGGVADKDGRLKVEDKIVGVGQDETGSIVDVIDMKLNDVVKLIRGPRATVVRLEVLTPGGEKKILKMTRQEIELKDSEAQGKVFEVGKRPDGTPFKIGVIDLPSFYMDMSGNRRGVPDYKSSTRDVKVILDDFNRKGVDAVVLDLRKNGGGSLTEAINLTGLFIPNGPVVQVKDADGHVSPFYDQDMAMTWSGPLIVVTSKFSASASEILAGAIQDYGRGLIVGDHSTHGKGTVQSLLDIAQHLFSNYPNLSSMGAIKVTMQQFYRPNGESTQKRGVLADVELPCLSGSFDAGEADLDYPLEFDRVDPMTFKHMDFVTQPICEQLRRLSADRVQASDKFQKEQRNIVRYKEQKAKKAVTLNEAKFVKEREELNADKEEEKTFEELNNAGNNGVVRDYYLDEVMAIATDYLNLRQIAKARAVPQSPLNARGG